MDKNRKNLRNVAAIVACLAVTVIFASCKKDTPEPKPAIFLLEEIQSDDGFRSVLEYDDKDRITKMTNYDNYGLIIGINTVTYNSSGDLTEAKWEDPENPAGNKTTFTKNGNQIIFFYADNNSNGKTTCELNDQGLPVKYTYEPVSGSGYIVTFTWQNGNCIKQDWEKDGQTYTFDDKKSPFYHCKSPKWLFYYWEMDYYNVNNIIKTQTSVVGVINTFEYTYNDDGFPVTRTENGFTTQTFKYRKK